LVNTVSLSSVISCGSASAVVRRLSSPRASAYLCHSSE
jgi:hypothetical protein